MSNMQTERANQRLHVTLLLGTLVLVGENYLTAWGIHISVRCKDESAAIVTHINAVLV
jgi:hypothetical protein